MNDLIRFAPKGLAAAICLLAAAACDATAPRPRRGRARSPRPAGALTATRSCAIRSPIRADGRPTRAMSIRNVSMVRISPAYRSPSRTGYGPGPTSPPTRGSASRASLTPNSARRACSSNFAQNALAENDGGHTWSVATSGDAGAGNFYDETVYALAGSRPCLAIRYFIHSTNIANYDPGTIKEFDRSALVTMFDRIRSTLALSNGHSPD